jgi:hypothetical protein
MYTTVKSDVNKTTLSLPSQQYTVYISLYAQYKKTIYFVGTVFCAVLFLSTQVWNLLFLLHETAVFHDGLYLLLRGGDHERSN